MTVSTYQTQLTDTTYNGWTNYETWNVALWLGNDEGLYHMAHMYREHGYKSLSHMLIEICPSTPDGVKWDDEKNKCYAGFTVSGDNVGVNESITVSGEALSFLSTGIDTRVYYIKNF